MAPLPAPQHPWYMTGGQGATTAFSKHEAQKFARRLVSSPGYQAFIEKRLLDGTLPPALEAMLWYYAYGKPMEQVQLTVQQGIEDLTTLSFDELSDRADQLRNKIDEVKDAEELSHVLQGPWAKP